MVDKEITIIEVFFSQKDCPNYESGCLHKAVYNVKPDGTVSLPIIVCKGSPARIVNLKKLNEPAELMFSKLGFKKEEE